MANNKANSAKSKTNASKPKAKASQKTEIEPRKLSREEQVLKNIEDNEAHMHEIDVVELNKETVEEALPQEILEESMQEIPASQIEIIDIGEENKESIFLENIEEPYINEQIEIQSEDLRSKMADIMGDRGIISRENEANEPLSNDKGEIVNEIKVTPGEQIKVYSNSNPEDDVEKERDVQHAEPLSEAEVTRVKQNVYSNEAPAVTAISEEDVNASINELMTNKNLSYLEAKAIVFDRIKRGEFLKKEVKKEEVSQQKTENQIQSSNIKISATPKIYKNG